MQYTGRDRGFRPAHRRSIGLTHRSFPRKRESSDTSRAHRLELLGARLHGDERPN